MLYHNCQHKFFITNYSFVKVYIDYMIEIYIKPKYYTAVLYLSAFHLTFSSLSVLSCFTCINISYHKLGK